MITKQQFFSEFSRFPPSQKVAYLNRSGVTGKQLREWGFSPETLSGWEKRGWEKPKHSARFKVTLPTPAPAPATAPASTPAAAAAPAPVASIARPSAQQDSGVDRELITAVQQLQQVGAPSQIQSVEVQPTSIAPTPSPQYRSSLIEALRQSAGNPLARQTVSFLANQTPPQNVSNLTTPVARAQLFAPPQLTMQQIDALRGGPGATTSIPSSGTPSDLAPSTPPDGNGASAPPDGNGGAVGAADGDGAMGAGVGQGIDNDLADIGLAMMAYGEAGKGLAPGSLAAGLLGSAIAGNQLDKMGQAADALAEIEAQDLPGVVSVSDRSGNVFGFSSPATVAASDAATFGTSLSAADEAVAQAMADYAESAPGDISAFAGMGGNIGDSSTGGSSVGVDALGPDGGGGGGGGGGGCFLTTAAVEHMGQDDDGDVLNTLRKFRDQFMLKDNSKRADVAAYYKHAPQIVEALNARSDAKNVYREMYETYILPAVDAIKSGDNDKAYEAYVAGVDWAMKQAANAE